MKGYKNIVDYYKIIDAFENSGFSKEDIIKIMSSNFFRVLSESLSPL
jgi:microsomal dipeptidase-like Zn-dependent dipeptidase